MGNKVFTPQPQPVSLPKTEQDEFLDTYVTKLLNSKSTNVGMIPDKLERKMYTLLLSVILGELKEIISKSSIIVLGHEIRMTINPLPPSASSTSSLMNVSDEFHI